MKETYEANEKYRLSILLISLVFFIPTLFALSDWIHGNKTFVHILLIIFLVIISCFSFWVAREVTISEQFVQFKTLILKQTVPIQKIHKISINYSMKEMIWHGGNKEKANMLCFVRYGSSPLRFFLIHSGISGYKVACNKLKEIKNYKIT